MSDIKINPATVETDDIVVNTLCDAASSMLSSMLEYLDYEQQLSVLTYLAGCIEEHLEDIEEFLTLEDMEECKVTVSEVADEQLPGQMRYPDDYENPNPLGTIYSSKPIFAQPKKDEAEERKAQRAAFRAAQQERHTKDKK